MTTKQQQIFSQPLMTLIAKDISVNNQRLLHTRWLAGICVLILTFICVRVLSLPLTENALYLLSIAILLYNLLLVAITNRIDIAIHETYLRDIRRIVILQVALDWVSVSIFIHFTGGISSPAIIFFVIHVLMVTILLPGHSPYIYVLLAVSVVTGLALLERSHLIPHHNTIPQFDCGLCFNSYYIMSQVVFFAAALTVTVFLANGIITRLHERERQIMILLKNMRDVNSSLELEQVLNQLTEGVAKAFDVQSASIRLLDSDGEQLSMAASYGLSQTYLMKGKVELSQSILDREALSGKVVMIDHATTDNRMQYPQEIAAEGIQSILVVPIVGRKPLGVLRVYAHEPKYFLPRDAEVVQTIAFQSASAIENALVYDALQRAEHQRTQFILHVTHELRAPITGAKSLLRVLLDKLLGDVPPQQRDILQRLEIRMDSLLALIRDLLALAESKSETQLKTAETVELMPVVAAIVDKLHVQAQLKQVQLELINTNVNPLTVVATENALNHILENIIGNAVKYTPEDGTVSVTLIEQAPSILIVVKDTGIGIPQSDLNRLGEEFYRASNARKSDIEGTGLGLAIVKHLISQFGGFISIQSNIGVGTTVTITLKLSLNDPVPCAP